MEVPKLSLEYDIVCCGMEQGDVVMVWNGESVKSQFEEAPEIEAVLE